ncbi:MAG: flagellar hook-basal body complex protein [Proteobacteria bacterium]|nr:flagellar hook-basal body complex protein [Pseudomonadota bacterium]
MPVYGPLAAPALGMLTQSSAFGTISLNVTNLNTGGYKATDTRFSTILASQFDNNFDIGGVKAVRKTYVSQQGNTVSSTNINDIAINGRGLFVLNSQLDGSGEQLYSRDGSLQTLKGPVVSVSGVFRSDGSFDTSGNTPGTTVAVNTNEVYLADKNGLYLQGYLADANGGFSVGGATVPVRIDQFAFSSDAAATTNATVAGNLPALDAAGSSQTMMASIFDSIRNAYWRIDGATYVATRLSEVGPAAIFGLSLEAITEFLAIWRFSGMGSPLLGRPKQDRLTPDEISILELRRQIWHPSGHPPLGRASMLVGRDAATAFIEHLTVLDSCISLVLANLTKPR